jgi:ubiquinone/menaquinone biosynthesis C-methylase UbiE
MSTESQITAEYKIPPKKIVRGIACYDESGYFYSEANLEETLALSSVAAKVGWRRAVLGMGDRFVRRYIMDSNRTLFLSILEIKSGENILDVGAGWGNVSAVIAKNFPSTTVYAVDKTLERLLFADQIKKQENLRNMRVVQCDITNPPFESGFFDHVIMIGVLEWLGASVQGMSPETAQNLGLRMIHRVMKPGGLLLIGIENRVGYRYFLGHADHTGMAFTSLMPRQIADIYLRVRGRGSYRTYTYTKRGYEKLLRKAGFVDVVTYAAMPDYRFPNVICDLDQVRAATYQRMAKFLPRKTVAAFTPSFYIIAKA